MAGPGSDGDDDDCVAVGEVREDEQTAKPRRATIVASTNEGLLDYESLILQQKLELAELKRAAGQTPTSIEDPSLQRRDETNDVADTGEDKRHRSTPPARSDAFDPLEMMLPPPPFPLEQSGSGVDFGSSLTKDSAHVARLEDSSWSRTHKGDSNGHGERMASLSTGNVDHLSRAIVRDIPSVPSRVLDGSGGGGKVAWHEAAQSRRNDAERPHGKSSASPTRSGRERLRRRSVAHIDEEGGSEQRVPAMAREDRGPLGRDGRSQRYENDGERSGPSQTKRTDTWWAEDEASTSFEKRRVDQGSVGDITPRTCAILRSDSLMTGASSGLEPFASGLPLETKGARRRRRDDPAMANGASSTERSRLTGDVRHGDPRSPTRWREPEASLYTSENTSSLFANKNHADWQRAVGEGHQRAGVGVGVPLKQRQVHTSSMSSPHHGAFSALGSSGAARSGTTPWAQADVVMGRSWRSFAGGADSGAASWAEKLATKREEQSVLVRQLERELASTVSALRDERRERRGQTEVLRAKLDEARHAIKERDAECERREVMLRTLMSETEALQSRCDRLSTSRSEKMDEAERSISRLKEENRELEDRLRRSVASAAEAQAGRDAAQAERDRAAREIITVDISAKAAERRAEQAEAAMATATDLAQVHQKTLSECRAESEGLRAKLEEARRRLKEEADKETTSSLRAQVADLERKLSAGSQRCVSLEARLGLLEKELEQIEREKVETHNQLRWALERVQAHASSSDEVPPSSQNGGQGAAEGHLVGAKGDDLRHCRYPKQDVAGETRPIQSSPRFSAEELATTCGVADDVDAAAPLDELRENSAPQPPGSDVDRGVHERFTSPPPPPRPDVDPQSRRRHLDESGERKRASDATACPIEVVDDRAKTSANVSIAEAIDNRGGPVWRSMVPPLFPPGWRDRQRATAAERARGRDDTSDTGERAHEGRTKAYESASEESDIVVDRSLEDVSEAALDHMGAERGGSRLMAATGRTGSVDGVRGEREAGGQASADVPETISSDDNTNGQNWPEEEGYYEILRAQHQDGVYTNGCSLAMSDRSRIARFDELAESGVDGLRPREAALSRRKDDKGITDRRRRPASAGGIGKGAVSKPRRSASRSHLDVGAEQSLANGEGTAVIRSSVSTNVVARASGIRARESAADEVRRRGRGGVRTEVEGSDGTRRRRLRVHVPVPLQTQRSQKVIASDANGRGLHAFLDVDTDMSGSKRRRANTSSTSGRGTGSRSLARSAASVSRRRRPGRSSASSGALGPEVTRVHATGRLRRGDATRGPSGEPNSAEAGQRLLRNSFAGASVRQENQQRLSDALSVPRTRLAKRRTIRASRGALVESGRDGGAARAARSLGISRNATAGAANVAPKPQRVSSVGRAVPASDGRRGAHGEREQQSLMRRRKESKRLGSSRAWSKPAGTSSSSRRDGIDDRLRGASKADSSTCSSRAWRP